MNRMDRPHALSASTHSHFPSFFCKSQNEQKLTVQNQSGYFSNKLTSWIGFVKHPDTRPNSRKTAELGCKAGVSTQRMGEEGRELDHLVAASNHSGSSAVRLDCSLVQARLAQQQ